MNTLKIPEIFPLILKRNAQWVSCLQGLVLIKLAYEKRRHLLRQVTMNVQ